MRRLATVALLAASLCLVVPSGAVAVTSTAPAAVRIEFGVHDGYRVTLSATNGTAVLGVEKRRGRGDAVLSTDYYTRAVLAGDRLTADFAGLGHVAMRFVPGGQPASPTCVGTHRRLVRRGTFVGTFTFQGESDYLDLDLGRARGKSAPRGHEAECEESETPRPKSHAPRHKLDYFHAGFHRGLTVSDFWAQTSRTGRVIYEAEVEEGGEQLAVFHDAFVEASPLTFATNSALSFLSVSPPYPFGGSGLVGRDATGRRTWSGSLVASFPGDPDVSLTGPQYRTTLIRQW